MAYNIADIWQYNLRKGATNHPQNGACLFDAGMWLVYGRIGDNPPCSCPVIRSYAIAGNDSMDNITRQKLRPFILRVVGNRDLEAEPLRLHYIVLETVRKILPLVLENTNYSYAQILKDLPDDASYDLIRNTSNFISSAYTATGATYAAATATAATYAATYAAATATDAATYAAATYAVTVAANAATYSATDAATYAAATAVNATAAAYITTYSATDAATYAAATAVNATAAVNASVWDTYISILDGALRIGKQAPDFDEAYVRQSVKNFTLAMQCGA